MLIQLKKNIDAWLIAFAKKSSSGAFLTPTKQTLIFGLPVLIVFIILTYLVFPQMVDEAKDVDEPRFSMNISNEHWMISLKEIATSADFWDTAVRRDKSDHHAYLDKNHGSSFWLGLKLNKEMLDIIKEKKAYTFYVGHIFGTHQFYINDELIKEGDRKNSRDPEIIDMRSWIEKNNGGELKLAIRITHDMCEPFPDTLHICGFATEDQIRRFQRWNDFRVNILASMATGFSLCLGIFFLALWFCSVRKQEVAAFAAFGFLHAVIQAGNLPLVWDRIGPDLWHRINFVTCFYESLFVLWLGASLARIRNKNLLVIMLFLLAAPWLIFLTDKTPLQIYSIVLQFWIWGTTSSYFIVSLICLSQAYLVKAEHLHFLNDAHRIKKLYLSAVVLALMGFWQYKAVHIAEDFRSYNIIVLTVLAAFVVHDYKRQDLILKKAPLSKYHERATLPAQVKCILATIDLKQSEMLYNKGAQEGVGALYVAEIISNFYQIIVARGGEVIQTDGDAIIFFFESDLNSNNFDFVVKVIAELDKSLTVYLETKQGGVDSSESLLKNIKVRAAIEAGAIRPVWQSLDGSSKPSWEQAGASKVFLDLARLMEAESKSAAKNKSNIVFQNRNRVTFDEKYQLLDQEVEIKHGRRIRFTTLTL